MKKIFILTIFTIAFALSAMAQSRISFGARAGLNVDHQLYTLNGITTLPDNQLGFHAGAVCAIRMFADLYFEPGLMFATKGSSTTYTGTGTSHNRLYYLEMPLLLSYFFTVIPDVLGLTLNIGPYGALGLFGNDVDYNGTKSAAFSKSELKRFDAGLRFGGGLEFHRMYLGLNYDMGLRDIAQKGNALGKVVNRSVMISMGYNF